MYPRERVRELLASEGAFSVESIDPRTDAYVTAWGHYLTVPAVGPDGMCPRMVLHEVLVDLRKTKPG